MIKKNNYNFRVAGLAKRVLSTQAKGLGGNIEELFEDLSDNSAWLGGTGECWERGPYYVDGLIPLAYLLERDILIKKVDKWCNGIIATQREDGFFGSARNVDWWPRMVVLKAFVGLHRKTNDPVIIEFLSKYFHYQLANLDRNPLVFWAKVRALEGFEGMQYVYEITKDEKILQLMKKIMQLAHNSEEYFSNFKYIKPTTSYINKGFLNFFKNLGEGLDKKAKESQRTQNPPSKLMAHLMNNLSLTKNLMLTHGVNVSMMVKYPSYMAMLKGDFSKVDECFNGYKQLLKIHGNALQIHSTDEHLMGNSPCQGVELCAVVELMYSYQELYRMTGDMKYHEYNQFLCFNVLPMLFDQEMKSHQYATQANQIRADVAKRQFFDIGKYSNTFGIEPNYGCCTANFHQGYPKFYDSAIMKEENHINILQLIQGEYSERVESGNIKFLLSGDFPFENTFRIEILELAKDYSIKIRIPKNYDYEFEGMNYNQFENYIQIEKAKAGDILVIKLNPKLKTIENSDGTVSFEYGALLLANKIKHEERYIKGIRPYHDKEYIPVEKFNFVPILKDGELQILSKKYSKKSSVYPFDKEEPTLEIKVKAVEVLNYGERKNSANDRLKSLKLGKETEITLVPICQTNLRISHFYKVNL